MIKTTSWHYRLANFGGRSVYPGDKVDFCAYFWNVVSGFSLLCMMLAVFGGAGGLLLVSVFQFFRWLFTGIPMHDLCIITLNLVIVLSIAFGFIFGNNKVKEYKEQYKAKQKGKAPGFFRLAYRKWKEKTCFILSVEDNDE